jgi:hypothetical protein
MRYLPRSTGLSQMPLSIIIYVAVITALLTGDFAAKQ